jgi:hypothetical protein
MVLTMVVMKALAKVSMMVDQLAVMMALMRG